MKPEHTIPTHSSTLEASQNPSRPLSSQTDLRRVTEADMVPDWLQLKLAGPMKLWVVIYEDFDGAAPAVIGVFSSIELAKGEAVPKSKWASAWIEEFTLNQPKP